MPDVLIRENTVRYFALTSELIFPWFGNIKKKYIRSCPRNWPYIFWSLWWKLLLMYFPFIFNNFLSKSDAPLPYMMKICYKTAPFIRKSQRKKKNPSWTVNEKAISIFKVLNWLMLQYRKTIVAAFLLKSHSPVLEMILFLERDFIAVLKFADIF